MKRWVFDVAAGVSLVLCMMHATTLSGAVSVADFDVAADRVDETAQRLGERPFSETARAAAGVLGKRKPRQFGFGNDPHWTKEQWEAFYRREETPAESVARLVWTKYTREPLGDDTARVLGEIATDRDTDVSTRHVALNVLRWSGHGPRELKDPQRSALYVVALHGRDDLDLRLAAAGALMRAKPRDPEDQLQREMLLRHVPAMIRAQPTLTARLDAFNDLTNIDMHQLPKDGFASMMRVGFELIDEARDEDSAHAYPVARTLGRMLRRPDEFAPLQSNHRDASGNLAPSFFIESVNNARRWWRETGRRALDEVAPVDPRE